MSTKKFIVFSSIILVVLLASLGINNVTASHNKLEEDLKVQRLQVETNEKELELKNQKLEEAAKLRKSLDKKIQKLNKEKKDLNEKLQAKAEAKAEQYATLAVAEPINTVKLASVHTEGVSHQTGSAMWCTDWVRSKRGDMGNWGNAGYNWISSAQASGLSTGSTPKAGSVAVTGGHVAYVESVNPDGTYHVSEMGWNYQAGNYNERTVSPGTFGGFIY